MFTKIFIFAVLVGCILVAHGAEKNPKFNADKVIKDLSKTISQISKRKSSSSRKKLNEMSLQTWNPYDVAFLSGWWSSSEFFFGFLLYEKSWICY